MEIGSFIGLDLRNTGEYYGGERNIARLNSARAGIYHSCKLYNCESIHIPHYLCPTVKRFLQDNSVEINPYFIDENFEPEAIRQLEGQAVLLVNYFGILSAEKIGNLTKRFRNIIIDNSAAFYSEPQDGCYSVYSPRKFFGVPDGCYVLGSQADRYVIDYDQDYSSNTASFLWRRLEYSTSATYEERMKNEERIDKSGVLRMSHLTRSLLCNIDYLSIIEKRQDNFNYAHDLFRGVNRLNPLKLFNNRCVPMVYPLVIEDEALSEKLISNKIYVGRLWKAVLNEVPDNSFEAYLSKYLVPIPIDQRYSKSDISHIYSIIV